MLVSKTTIAANVYLCLNASLSRLLRGNVPEFDSFSFLVYSRSSTSVREEIDSEDEEKRKRHPDYEELARLTDHSRQGRAYFSLPCSCRIKIVLLARGSPRAR